jgi:hypothetical protein
MDAALTAAPSDLLPARARTPPRSWASHPFTAHTVFLVVIVTFTFSAFVVLVAYPALKGEVYRSFINQ